MAAPRLVAEQEVVAAALTAHGPLAAEKFSEEVIWRGYFKGWLERRPQVWARYLDGLAADFAALDRDRGQRRDVDRAMNGRTGLACFDAWATELPRVVSRSPSGGGTGTAPSGPTRRQAFTR